MAGNANANGIPFLKRYGIPPAIKNSMVLWYDIARQGATNESMAENPILKDLSGNGHDITCYNFAWSGMSGIGGYISNKNVDKWYKSSNNNGTYITKGNTIHISKLNTNKRTYYVTYNSDAANEYIELQGNTYTTKPFNIKISGLPEGKQVKIYGTVGASDAAYNTSFSIQYFNNGTFTVESASCIWNHDIQPIIFNFPSFFIDSDTADDVDITIELLPQYPNALVSDGVDDYASFPLSQNLFNRNTTYIAKYIKISDTGKWQYLFDVNNPDGSTDTDYPDRLYVGNPSNTDNYYGYSDNIIQNDGIVIIGKPREYTYGYTPHFNLFASSSKDNFANAALYSLILFNRTLTADEIEWVKANLINGYPTPNVYYDCSLYTNETVDSTNPVLKDLSGHGHDLALKNFAFTTESGFDGNGALVFDGVDDYGAGTRDSFDKCTMLMLFKPIDVDGTVSVDLRHKVNENDYALYRFAPDVAYNNRNSNGTYINNKLNTTLNAYSLINKKHLVGIKGIVNTTTTSFTVGANNFKTGYFDKMALYKFLLFDQELTQEQIDKVIQDYHLMDDVDDVWNQ